MVCNTTQSALYKVVCEYNSELDRKEKNLGGQEKKTSEKIPSKTEKKHIGNSSEKNNWNYRKNYRQAQHKNYRVNYCGKNTQNNSFADPVSRLLSDSDLMLICTLIFILSKNGADKKIILALIFVLIS